MRRASIALTYIAGLVLLVIAGIYYTGSGGAALAVYALGVALVIALLVAGRRRA